MDFAPVLDGFTVVLEPTNLLYCLIGVVVGMLVGVLPGLGPAATIAILLPITMGIEPVTGDHRSPASSTAPSTAARSPRCCCGCPARPRRSSRCSTATLARQGKAHQVPGIAAIGSFIGGTISIIALTFLAPLVATTSRSTSVLRSTPRWRSWASCS